MHSELTNLLPIKRQRALSRNYFLRFSVVGIALFSTLILVSAVLLFPTYVFLAENERANEMRLANVESSFSSSGSDETALTARLEALTSDAAVLVSLSSTPSASNIIREVVTTTLSGIVLSDFVYTSPADNSPGSLALSGIAKTRDALRNYQLALQNIQFVASATLPVSAYAQDTDIIFTITVMLAP